MLAGFFPKEHGGFCIDILKVLWIIRGEAFGVLLSFTDTPPRPTNQGNCRRLGSTVGQHDVSGICRTVNAGTDAWKGRMASSQRQSASLSLETSLCKSQTFVITHSIFCSYNKIKSETSPISRKSPRYLEIKQNSFKECMDQRKKKQNPRAIVKKCLSLT